MFSEPFEEVPLTKYFMLDLVEYTVTSALLVVTVTPLSANGLMTLTLEPL